MWVAVLLGAGVALSGCGSGEGPVLREQDETFFVEPKDVGNGIIAYAFGKGDRGTVVLQVKTIKHADRLQEKSAKEAAEKFATETYCASWRKKSRARVYETKGNDLSKTRRRRLTFYCK